MPLGNVFLMGINVEPFYKVQDKCWGGSMAYGVQAAVQYAFDFVTLFIVDESNIPTSADIFMEDWAAAFSEMFDCEEVLAETTADSFWDTDTIHGVLDKAFAKVVDTASFETDNDRVSFVIRWSKFK